MFHINLEIQHNVYTFDTSCFYTDEEEALDRKLKTLRKQLNDDKELRRQIAAMLQADTAPELTQREKLKRRQQMPKKRRYQKSPTETIEEKQQRLLSASDISDLNAQIRSIKNELKTTIEANSAIDRIVRPEALCGQNVVSIFDSNLTRCLGMQVNGINDQLVIVKVYFFGIAENIIKNGFYMNGKHYVFFSASAGQIRTKKLVAIKESAYLACENQLTCGLTVDKINKQGGVNINKYLAYLALCNSATTEWSDFPIERSIVIDDFETLVPALVDEIDPTTYQIERKQENVPITHTDGCGMVLPEISSVNFMVRAPWIKGLLSPFPFDKFILEANKKNSLIRHELIRDIYGIEHDILKENIQIIFTKSQFKMWAYFSNWNEYQRNFRKYSCSAGKCNEEPERIGTAKFNYQMLQTLTDLTEKELDAICQKTNRKLRDIASDRQTMLQVFGATRPPENRNAFQKCLAYYPELLQDSYCRESLRDLKNSIELQAVSGRFDVDGKYLFLIPDLYAACEHWFCHIDIPSGLLQNGEVFAWPYQRKKSLDVLRSPHLYKEHAVRENVAMSKSHLHKWFHTDGIYTSSHDVISKILQFDNDGDRALVCADPTIIAAAERNCSDIVPLYYPMAKAAAVQITPEAKFNGMVAAWTGGNIGEISNSITKIWNSPNPDLDAVKILCMENNFVIDYAKTLFKPTRPPEWDIRIKAATSGRVPNFFIYAKDKTNTQVESPSQSVVNRLSNSIQSYKFNFQRKQLGTFDYKMLMHSPEIEETDLSQKIIKTYTEITRATGDNNIAISDDRNGYVVAVKQLKAALSVYGSDEYITDVLIDYLFHKKKSTHKAMFWDCYGDVVYQNLQKNRAGEKAMCQRCGARFVPMYPKQCLCPECEKEAPKKIQPFGVAVCLECGREFTAHTLSEKLCPVCQWLKNNHNTSSATGDIRTCESCGSPFTASNRRGRPQKFCPTCRKMIENQQTLKRVKRFMRKKCQINR